MPEHTATPSVALTGRVHDLKTWPEPFEGVRLGIKTLELRFNDRDYWPGDVLRLREWDPDTGGYSGSSVHRVVTYVMYGGQFGLESGYVAMSIAPCEGVMSDEECLSLLAAIRSCRTPDDRGEDRRPMTDQSGRAVHCECHADHERELLDVIDQRDRVMEMADRLANAIAPDSEIGEHSNANDPWVNALCIAGANERDRWELTLANRAHGRTFAAIRAAVGLRHTASSDQVVAKVRELVAERGEARAGARMMGESFGAIAVAAGMPGAPTSCEVQTRVQQLVAENGRLRRLADAREESALALADQLSAAGIEPVT